MADMLHLRYKQVKSRTCMDKDTFSGEIQVLKWVQMDDSGKAKLPEGLKYRHRGHMYSPHKLKVCYL